MEINQQQVAMFGRDRAVLGMVESTLAQSEQFRISSRRADFSRAVSMLRESATADILLIEVQPDELQQLTRLAQVTPPGCRVILFGQEINIAQYRQLIQLGVSDYLTLPLEPTALRRTLQHACGITDSVSFHHGVVHLVTGTSGGVGVSTVAANLAYGLGGVRSTALVDFNTTHSQHPILLGVDYQPALHQLAQDIERMDALLIQQFAQPVGEQLHLFYTEQQAELSAETMLRIVNKLKQQFSYVVIDLPCHLSERLAWLLTTVDNTLLVHDYSLQAGRRMDTILAAVDTRQHHMQIIGNQSRARSHKPWSHAQLLEAWNVAPCTELPFDGKAVQRCEHAGRPVFSQRGRLATALNRLTTNVSGGV